LNSILVRAVIVVSFALIFYSICGNYRTKKTNISKPVLFFLTTGVSLDVASTVLMIIGARRNMVPNSRNNLAYSSSNCLRIVRISSLVGMSLID